MIERGDEDIFLELGELFFLGSEQLEIGKHWRGDSENREEKKLGEKVREGGTEVYYEV